MRVCGVGAGILGDSTTNCMSDSNRSASGNLVAVPVTVCAVGAGVFGDAQADCTASSTISGDDPTISVHGSGNPGRTGTAPDDVNLTPRTVTAPTVTYLHPTLITAPKQTQAATDISFGRVVAGTGIGGSGPLASTGFDASGILPLGIALLALGGLLLLIRRRQSVG